MTPRAARRWLWLGFVLMLPFPMLGPFGGFLPAARYAILFAATAAIAVVEGAAGPVQGILMVFGVHLLATLALTWLLAWIASRALAPLSDARRRNVVCGVVAVMLVYALAFEPYQTPFGRAATAGLLGILS
jgi:hypothetical protein